MKSGKGLLILAGKPGEDEEEDGPSDMKKTAIKTLFAAMKSGDVDAGAKAFKAAYDACASDSEEYSEDE